MAEEKKIVYKVPDEVKAQSIETLKVKEEVLEYLRANDFKIIDDVVRRKEELPPEIKGSILGYLILGLTNL